jgi:hypothetical protein
LDKEWEHSVSSDWEGSLGQHSEADAFRYLEENNEDLTIFDTSGMGVGNDVIVP